jgi:hypothetical protein
MIASSDTRDGIPIRELGRTGERVTIIGLGGFHIGKARDSGLAERIIRNAVDEGVNFLDNAWCYNDGDRERYMGAALRGGYRHKVLLMTKNHGRRTSLLRPSFLRLSGSSSCPEHPPTARGSGPAPAACRAGRPGPATPERNRRRPCTGSLCLPTSAGRSDGGGPARRSHRRSANSRGRRGSGRTSRRS